MGPSSDPHHELNLPAPVILTTQNASALGVFAHDPQQIGQPFFFWLSY